MTFITLIVLLVEGYLAYNHLYKNFTIVEPTPDNDKIVRVDNASYKTMISYLHQLKIFAPDFSAPVNPNPFK
ncbi:MAG: hypothetical protein KW788_02230 [Candidatus Doudnabacteria bacterium]|nr:hypothetical protein [Candidatus Doudnabacteria bacterium]